MAPRKTDPIVRFNAKVERTDYCWEWRAARNSRGYGVFYPNWGKQVGAHRYSYEIHVGPIPDGLFVLHSCDNPGCVNPEHLRVGTQRENLQDRTDRGRVNARRGSQAHNAKLTEADVLAIRSDPRSGTVIAKEYGIDFSHIYKIRRRGAWTHI